jgi:hypothetical protein
MHHQPHPHANILPGLQSWHGNSSISSASSGASAGPATNGQANNGNNGTNANGAEPPMLNRRSNTTIDSPRMPSGGSTPVSAGRLSFDDRLASNGSAAVGMGVDPHMRSHPPSPPLSLSRSSTNTNHQSESHTPPPPRDP